MKIKALLIGGWFLICGLYGCQFQKKIPQITIFAASSLSEVVRALTIAFEERENIEVRLNFASTGTLARQVENGAGADFFISANSDWVDYLDEKGLVKSSRDIAWNRLVLVTYVGSRFAMMDTLTMESGLLLGNEKIAIGSPETVPAGKYARQALNHYRIFDQWGPFYLMGKDVRTVLRYVELKEAVLGIVYHTDAVRSKSVVTKFSFPGETHDPVVYRAAITSESEYAERFMRFLQSPDAVTIWKKYGFIIDEH